MKIATDTVRFLVLPFILLLAFLFQFPSSVNAQLCPGGYTYCGESSSCPGSDQCCTYGGPYPENPCTVAGRSCFSNPSCPSQACGPGNPCNPPSSNTCTAGDCVAAECVSGTCVYTCLAPGTPGCSSPGATPPPSVPPASCNTNCAGSPGICSPSGLVCDNSRPGATNTCRNACDLDSPICGCPAPSSCGNITNDHQSGFETGEAFTPVLLGGATVSEGRVNMTTVGIPSSGNGQYAERVIYTAGPGFSLPSNIYTMLPTGVLPSAGQEAYFTLQYYIGSMTGSPQVTACVQWVDAFGAQIGLIDCQFFTMSVGGFWGQAQVHSQYRAGGDHLRILIGLTGGAAGNTTTFYIDHLCMSFGTPCATPGVPGGLTAQPAACGVTNRTLTWNAAAPAANTYNVYVTPQTNLVSDRITCTCPTCTAVGARCDIAGIAGLSQVVSEVTPGVVYDWGVQSAVSCGAVSNFATSTFTTAACIGSLRARALRDDSGLTGAALCAANASDPTGKPSGHADELDGATFTLNGANLKTQTSGYVTPWLVNVGTAYTLSPSVPGYVGPTYCYESTQVSPTIANPVTLTTGGEVGTWDVVYPVSAPWVQFRNGNVHSNSPANPSIDISAPTLPVQYMLTANDPTLNTAGIMSYIGVVPGTLANQLEPNRAFLADDDGGSGGNVAHTQIGASYYDYYFDRFGNKTVIQSGLNAPSGDPNDWYIVGGSGAFTVSGIAGWHISGARRVVVFVPHGRQLVINGNITVEHGSSLVFIVGDGGILVDSSVGQTVPFVGTSVINRYTNPNIAGIFLTDGVFTVEANITQFIGTGVFVAEQFQFNRDLGSINDDTPAEMFIYRADLVWNSPRQLREIKLKWQEVAP